MCNVLFLNLSLTDILITSVGRRYLTIFLEPIKASALVDTKHAPKSQWHHLGTEIFYNYIRVPKPELKIEKSDRKLIETFLLGDAGPDIFYQIQSSVVKTLEDKYFPSFLLSEQYTQLKDALNSGDFKDSTLNSLSDGQKGQTTSLETENQMDVATHTTYARKKLEQIQERLDKKSLALDALKCSVKPESKVLVILEKEMEWLKNEKRQTEAHLRRRDAWSDHIGKWKATIQSLEVLDEKESLQFMVLVHVDEDINNPTSHYKENRPSNISSGWVVLRSMTLFHELHRKLRTMQTTIRDLQAMVQQLISDKEQANQKSTSRQDHIKENQQAEVDEVYIKEIDELKEKISEFESERHEFQLKIKSQDRFDSLNQNLSEKDNKISELEEHLQYILSEHPDSVKLLATMESDKIAASRALNQNYALKKQLDELELRFVQLTNDKADLVNKLDAEEYVNRETRKNFAI